MDEQSSRSNLRTPTTPSEPFVSGSGSGGLHLPDCGSVSSSQSSSVSSRRSSRPPPSTPRSNFDVGLQFVSSSSSSDGSGDDEDIFPPGYEARRGDRIVDDRSERSLSESPLGRNPLSAVSEAVIGDHGSIHGEVIRRKRRVLEGRAEEERKDVVMSVLWAGNRLAAAYYDLETGLLFMLPDIADAPPDYGVLRSAFRQIGPNFLLVNRSSDERFLEVVYELTGHSFGDNEDQGANGTGPANTSRTQDNVSLHVLPSREFAPEACRQRVNSLKISYEPKNNGPREHLTFIASLVPTANDNLLRAMGCLLRFLDKKAIELFQLDVSGGQVPVLDVNLFKMDELVIVDNTAWQSLQIFTTDFHPSLYKQVKGTGSKEGLSIFSLLNRCVTTQGTKNLKNMLLRPSRNKEVLSRRYDTLDYILNANNSDFVTAVLDALKSVKSIPKLLYRLSVLHATVSEWNDMYQTLYHCLLIAELCGSRESAPQLIKNIGAPEYIETLRSLTQEMFRIIDFSESVKASRICSNGGLDEDLDKKKRQFACIPDIISVVASEEIPDLPQYVKRCCVVYIPEVGYLLALTAWNENLSESDILIENLELRFRTSELIYYKSQRMRELDVILGDLAVAILEKETLMMVALTEIILQRSTMLHKINDHVAELDSLFAMAKIAKSYDFCRPELVDAGHKLKIIDGWHPLSAMTNRFVNNSTIFREMERVVVITGPNNSGKSIYLKQIGVIVIMALSGCFVPAKFARIPLFDKICTRVHALESISTGFSSFMVDINQMAVALRSSCNKSLVIIDEFGKGTTEADGFAILTASIQDFLDREEDCPTIFLSTHFTAIIKYLKPSPKLKFQTMKFMNDNGAIVYLYELIDGHCERSFASLIAKDQLVPLPVVNRMDQIERTMREGTGDAIELIAMEKRDAFTEYFKSVAEEFLQMNFDTENPVAYLARIKRGYDAVRLGCEQNQ